MPFTVHAVSCAKIDIPPTSSGSKKTLGICQCFYQESRALSTSLAIKQEAALPKWFVGVFVGVFFHSDKLPNHLKKTVSSSLCCFMLQSFHIL